MRRRVIFRCLNCGTEHERSTDWDPVDVLEQTFLHPSTHDCFLGTKGISIAVRVEDEIEVRMQVKRDEIEKLKEALTPKKREESA